MALRPEQTLELDLALPPEVLNEADFASDAWYPILRMTFYAGYKAGTEDALGGCPWALAKRVLGK